MAFYFFEPYLCRVKMFFASSHKNRTATWFTLKKRFPVAATTVFNIPFRTSAGNKYFKLNHYKIRCARLFQNPIICVHYPLLV